jgi:hypothetical protein
MYRRGITASWGVSGVNIKFAKLGPVKVLDGIRVHMKNGRCD